MESVTIIALLANESSNVERVIREDKEKLSSLGNMDVVDQGTDVGCPLLGKTLTNINFTLCKSGYPGGGVPGLTIESDLFDRNDPVGPAVIGFVDRTKAAMADLGNKFVRTEGREKIHHKSK